MNGKKRMLITGGSGFLGGILALGLQDLFDVAYTYTTKSVDIPGCRKLWLDLTRKETVTKALKEFSPEIVVHAAALANAAICQKDPKLAEEINVNGTEYLMHALPNRNSLLIYISTDLVFSGARSFYAESDEPHPVSAYGASKYQAERVVQESWPHHIILRPALIYGPTAPSGKGSFLQWMDANLKKGEKINLFSDEFRTPVYALDIVRAIYQLIDKHGGPYRIYHLGGPERMTRIQFAEMLIQLRGHDRSLIQPVRLSDHSTGYARPADVSLNSKRIQESIGLKTTPTHKALEEIFRSAV